MKIQINCTKEGTCSYPLHTHKVYEVLYYLEGNGVLRTQNSEYPFSPGTIIIIPPEIAHGSVSELPFKNIGICCNFEYFFDIHSPVCLCDNEISEGEKLVKLILYNRFSSNEYLDILSKAYASFIRTVMPAGNSIPSSVKALINKISNNADDPEFTTSELLDSCGYSKDYIRSVFRKHTGKTPTEFLTLLRINNACRLIELYKNNLSLSQIAERSGFLDYAYFSKIFKRHTGETPLSYRRNFL